ncbi:hypothetical protein [Nonomuraea dietziae]|uniref:hypothetical protein n=1 Tax=Nonomuraea dietziae TaxID=65515 RepID=UPI0031D36631
MTVMAAPDPFTTLCADIDQIIGYASTHQPRSLQQQLGPSDLGSPCDRRLGFQLARIPPCNFPSKWEAYIGTRGARQARQRLRSRPAARRITSLPGRTEAAHRPHHP